MIEAMEKQILKNIRNPFLKNEKSRKSFNFNDVSDALRVICSSRSSFYPLFKLINDSYNEYSLKELLNKIHDVYDFITLDCVNEIIDSYENPKTKDSKKNSYYIDQLTLIREDLFNIKNKVCELTLDKLLIFHRLNKD